MAEHAETHRMLMEPAGLRTGGHGHGHTGHSALHRSPEPQFRHLTLASDESCSETLAHWTLLGTARATARTAVAPHERERRALNLTQSQAEAHWLPCTR